MQCHNNLADIVGGCDHLGEGLVDRSDLKNALEQIKIKELGSDELNELLRSCDRAHKGYIASAKFIEILYSHAPESEGEVLMRRLGKSLQHSKTNLKSALENYCKGTSGRLDKESFKKAMKQLSVGLND
jgi:hypothetical protein